MAARAASLVQADYDRAVSSLTKAGLVPEIVFDLGMNCVIVRAANETVQPKSNWQEGAPDRV